MCVLADQIHITSQNRKILGRAYSEAQVQVPCSNSFQSSDLYAWNLHLLGTRYVWVMVFMHGDTNNHIKIKVIIKYHM
jgi:hypothetical protein